MPSVEEFKVKLMEEQIKVNQSLLKMKLEVSKNMTYIENHTKLEFLDALQEIIDTINSLYNGKSKLAK